MLAWESMSERERLVWAAAFAARSGGTQYADQVVWDLRKVVPGGRRPNKTGVILNAVLGIEEDILWRSGIGNALDQIDSDIRGQMRAKWREILEKALGL